MRNRFQLFVPVIALLASAVPASAWTPPAVGLACPGARGPGPQQVAIAGNYLGGRAIRDGIVDWKSFQACFETAGRCENWLAEKSRRFPLHPGIATCTRIIVR